MPKAKFAAARKQQGKTKPKKAGVRPGAQLSSKRRLSRFGKERRKGESGTAAAYITRTRAIKKLQMTIRDFRYDRMGALWCLWWGGSHLVTLFVAVGPSVGCAF